MRRRQRRDTEVCALSTLAGRLAVPRIRHAGDDTLTTELLPGAHGQDLIAGGHAAGVLRSCGPLDALFEGYGDRPPFARRRAAAPPRCREMRDRPDSHPVWAERVAATGAWTE